MNIPNIPNAPAADARRKGELQRRPCRRVASTRRVGFLSLLAAACTSWLPAPAQAQSLDQYLFCDGGAVSESTYPCNNIGHPGNGRQNSRNPYGAHGSTTGNAYTDADTLRFVVTGTPPTATVFFVQSAAYRLFGPIPFGDGHMCLAAPTTRLGVRTAAAGQATFGFGNPNDPLISARGLIPSAGGWYYYQAFYRDSQANFCSPAFMNTTNAWAIRWGPTPAPQPISVLPLAKSSLERVPDPHMANALNNGITQLTGTGVEPGPDGQWIIKEPVFVAGDMGTNSPRLDWHIDLEEIVNNTSMDETKTYSVSFSGGFGALKLGAQFNQANSTVSNGMTGGISLTFRSSYEPKIADLRNIVLSQTARDILQSSSLTPQQKATAWRQHFGTHVVVGYEVAGKLGLRATLDNNSSQQKRTRFASFKGKYGSTTANASASDFALDAINTGAIHLTLDEFGNAPYPPNFQIPTDASQLDTEQERTAFANNVLAMAMAERGKSAALLLPMTSFPGAPVDAFANWENDVVERVGGEAVAAVESIADAHLYNCPSFRSFLNARQVPGEPQTFMQKLDQARNALITNIDDLYYAFSDYMVEQHRADPAYRQVVETRLNEVAADRVALDNAILAIEELGRTLPPMTVEMHEQIHSSPTTTHQHAVKRVTLVISNAAIFTDPVLDGTQLLNWLSAHDGENYSLCLREDEWEDTHYNLPHWLFGSPMYSLESPVIISNSIIASGPGVGLRTITVEVGANLNVSSRILRAEVHDDLGRIASKQIDIDASN